MVAIMAVVLAVRETPVVVKEVLVVVAKVVEETAVMEEVRVAVVIKACVNQWDITIQWRRNNVEQ